MEKIFFFGTTQGEEAGRRRAGLLKRLIDLVWPEEHDLIPTPFEELKALLFRMQKHWTIEEDDGFSEVVFLTWKSMGQAGGV